MNKEKLLQTYLPKTIACDQLKINYLSKDDIEICNYVSNLISYTPLSIFNLEKSINLKTLIDMSLTQIEFLKLKDNSKISDIISKTPIHHSQPKHIFKTIIGYSLEKNQEYFETVIPDSGSIYQYDIPRKLYLSDITPFSHELCHSLKDTNYKEYVNIYTIDEVIPMFYDLISIENTDNIKKRNLQIRMHYSYLNKLEFLTIQEFIENELNKDVKYNRNVYNYLQSRDGCYLNSFYYTLILYHMYKENPLKILTLVKKVLNHEITTIEMLNYLGIYNNIQGEIFEKELNEIKKILKK